MVPRHWLGGAIHSSRTFLVTRSPQCTCQNINDDMHFLNCYDVFKTLSNRAPLPISSLTLHPKPFPIPALLPLRCWLRRSDFPHPPAYQKCARWSKWLPPLPTAQHCTYVSAKQQAPGVLRAHQNASPRYVLQCEAPYCVGSAHWAHSGFYLAIVRPVGKSTPSALCQAVVCSRETPSPTPVVC